MSSSLGQQIKILHLKANMRAKCPAKNCQRNFQDLLAVGDSDVPSAEVGEISVSQICNIVNIVHELNAVVFPGLNKNFRNTSWLCESAILVPENTNVANINEELLQCLSGILQTLLDTIVDLQSVVHCPEEILKFMKPSRPPPTALRLRIGPQ